MAQNAPDHRIISRIAHSSLGHPGQLALLDPPVELESEKKRFSAGHPKLLAGAGLPSSLPGAKIPAPKKGSSLLRGLHHSAPFALTILAPISVIVRLQIWTDVVIYPYDAYYYMGTATSLASGAGYAWRGHAHTRFLPGYPLSFAPLVNKLGPELAGVTIAAVAWAVLGVLCYFVARRHCGSLAGIASASVVLFHPVAIEWTTVPMAEGVFALAAYSSLALMIQAVSDSDPKPLVLAGSIGGYAAITRNEGVALLPIYVLCALWILYKKRSTSGSQQKPVSFFLSRKSGGVFFVLGLILLLIPYLLWITWSSGKPSTQLSYASEVAANLRSGIADFFSSFLYYSWQSYRQPLVTALGYMGFLWFLRKHRPTAVILGLWLAFMATIHSMWYFRYDRFALASVPALAIASGAIIGAISTLGNETIKSSNAPSASANFKHAYLLCGLVLIITGSGVVSYSDGRALSYLHISLLQRGGGQALVIASQVGKYLQGKLASSAGAVTEYHSKKPVLNVLPQYSEQDLAAIDPKERPCRKMIACFDPDQLAGDTPEERLEQLREAGVRFLILQLDNSQPEDVLRALKLPATHFSLRAAVITKNGSNHETNKAAILRVD